MAINKLRQQIFDQFNVPQYDIGNTGGVSFDPSPPFEESVLRSNYFDEDEQLAPPGMSDISFRPSGLPTVQGLDNPTPPPNLPPELRDYYTPQTEATKRYNELLAQFPERESPSIARRLVASGMGLGGHPENAMKVMEGPNARNLAEWTAKTQPYYNAAQLENQANIQERSLAQTRLTTDLNERRYADQNRINEEKNRITEEKNKSTAELTRQRNEIAFAKASGATAHVRGQNVILTWPDGTVQDTGVPTTAFSPIELESLRQGGRITAIRETGDQARQTEGVRQEGRIELKETPSSTDKIDTPNETRVRQALTAREIINRDPELGKYIKFQGPNDFTMTPPTRGYISGVSGDLKKRYDDAVKRIYGETTPTSSGTGRMGGPAPSATTGLGPSTAPQMPSRGSAPQMPKEAQPPGPVPAGRIAVRDRAGNWVGTIPNSQEQIEMAISKGYRVEVR